MARERRVPSRQQDLPPRPLWVSPVPPFLLLLAAGALLLLDGAHPYRVFLKKHTWKATEAQLVQSFERRQVVNPAEPGGAIREYLERRPQRRVFEETVSVGWPMSRKKLMWRVRLTYTYRWKKSTLTKLADEPVHLFATEKLANGYLERRIRDNELTVWVNPKDPDQVTAFPEYRRLWNVYLGLSGVGLGLLWLVVALVLGRSHRRREEEEARIKARRSKENQENP